MKSVDVELINAKNQSLEVAIQKAKFIEELESEGVTGEDLKNRAKQILQISEDDLVSLNVGKMKQFNKETMAFIQLVAFRNKAEESGLLSSEELETVRTIESRVAEKVALRYDVEVEDLYSESGEE